MISLLLEFNQMASQLIFLRFQLRGNSAAVWLLNNDLIAKMSSLR